jgi:hypothetical protein
VASADWHISIGWPEKNWYSDPDLVITIFPGDSAYAVTVEIVRPENEPPFATGVAIRAVHQFSGALEGRIELSMRDIQRLPLTRIVRAAISAAAKAPPSRPPEPEGQGQRGTPVKGRRSDVVYYDATSERDPRFSKRPDWLEEARRVLVPRGRPKRGNSARFYRELADMYRELTLRGLAFPVKEIARRKRVPENTVHQWIYRARKLGFLEAASPRRTNR